MKIPTFSQNIDPVLGKLDRAIEVFVFVFVFVAKPTIRLTRKIRFTL